LRTAHDETASRIDEKFGFGIEQVRGKDSLDDLCDAEIANLAVFHVSAVLRGDNDVRNAHGLVVVVLDRDLALCVGPKPFDLSSLTDASQFATEAMGEHDWRRHQFGRFIGGVTKHQALVASALFGGFFSFRGAVVDTLGDVLALAGDDVHHEDTIGVENVVVIHVTDIANGIADDLDVIQLGVRGDFAADNHDVAFGVRFAGHAAARILGQAGVKHSIGNGIADFVRMTFPDRFGRENKTSIHFNSAADDTNISTYQDRMIHICAHPSNLKCIG
jgi:hypothetical protein